MKTCSKCNVEKDGDEFRWQNKLKGIKSPWCKSCFSEYEKEKWKTSKSRRISNKEKREIRGDRNCEFIWNFLLTNPCMDCGESNPIVLDFDHKNPKEKFKNISDMRRSAYSLEKIKEEIDKCEVVCANCHRIRTSTQFNFYKNMKC